MKIATVLALTAASAAAFAPPVALTRSVKAGPLSLAEEAEAEAEEAEEAAPAPAPAAPASTCMSREAILASPNTIEFGSKWDPLGLSDMGSDETIAWFRHSEIKHGRVAMAAFVGWWAVGSGLRFPGELAHGLDFSSIPSKGLEAWDAVPGWGKAQMLIFAALIEFHDELFFSRRGTHYMRGGTPGKVRMTVSLHLLIFYIYFSHDLFPALYRTWSPGFSILSTSPRTRAKRRRHAVVMLRSRTDVLP